LAALLSWAASELRDHLVQHFQRRDCYDRVWRLAGEREGFGPVGQPRCLWAEDTVTPPTLNAAADAPQTEEVLAVASSWDAGDMGCGDLVLALRGRLNSLPPGAVLKVRALDPAAPLDLPAWCRLTGHRLLRAVHPEYHFQRKES
jgi:tRNA 2-thiouridine synthesizing protein A